MKIKQLKKTLKHYKNELDEAIIKPIKNQPDKELEHCRWMIDEIEKMINKPKDERDREKIMRWLGFMQGVFYSHNLYTIDEMRDHNR